MKYVVLKVSIFALICLKYVAAGDRWSITNGSGYFISTSSDFDLRLNFTSYSNFSVNKANLNCISTLLKRSNHLYEINVTWDECTKTRLPLSNTGSNCSRWSVWSNCSATCGNGTKTRVQLCTQPDGTMKDIFNTIECNVTPECEERSTQKNRQEDVTDDAQNITSAHIAIVAIASFLMGILVAALLSMFYMKRKQQGCFCHSNKSGVEVGSRMQSGPDLQSQTTRGIDNEYESTENKNENKTVETSYQSLDLDKISTDQQTYGHLELEPPFEHRDNKPPSGHQKLTLNNGNLANTTPSKIGNVYEYERDSQDNENVFRLCKPNSKGQKENYTEVEDMAREVCGENGITDHVYSVLEPDDNTSKMQGRESDAEHNYFVLETIDKVAEVGSG